MSSQEMPKVPIQPRKKRSGESLYNATANETWPEAELQRGLSPYSCPAFSAYCPAGATQARTSTAARA